MQILLSTNSNNTKKKQSSKVIILSHCRTELDVGYDSINYYASANM